MSLYDEACYQVYNYDTIKAQAYDTHEVNNKLYDATETKHDTTKSDINMIVHYYNIGFITNDNKY